MNAPAAQPVQVVAPVREYLPAPQLEHVTVPVTAEYFPDVQCAQRVDVVAPVMANASPAEHKVQTKAPVSDEYIPARQARHFFPLRYCPAAHIVDFPKEFASVQT